MPSKTPEWKVAPGKPIDFINSVATSADGKRVVCGTFYHYYGKSQRGAYVPRVGDEDETGIFGTYCYNQSGAPLWKDEFDGWQGTYWVDLSSDGKFAASGGWYSNDPYAGFVRAYDAATGKILLDFRTACRVNQVALSSDGKWLVSGAETLILFKRGVGKKFGKVAVFDPSEVNDTIETVAISADGKRVICGDYNSNLYVFDNKAGKLNQIATWKLQSGYSHCIRITPDGSAFVTGGPSGYVYYFDIAELISTGQPTASFQCPAKSSVYGVAVADDGSAFVGLSNVGKDGGQVCFIDRTGGTATLRWKKNLLRNPNCASLNLKAGLLAVADGHPNDTPGHFSLFETAKGKLRWRYTTKTNMSWPIMISQNGKAIVAGSDDSNLYYFTP